MSSITTACLSHGLFLPEVGGGECSYADPGSVLFGVDRGDGTLGTLHLPSADKVLQGTGYGAGGNEYGGLYVVPAPCAPCPPPYPPRDPAVPVVYPRPAALIEPNRDVPRLPRSGFCDEARGGKWWVATVTYTAVCKGGVGTPVTITRQARSSISEQDAQRIARDLAEKEAKAVIECTFTAVKCATPSCDPDADPVCATAISHVSLSDAEAQALALAQAEAELQCL